MSWSLTWLALALFVQPAGIDIDRRTELLNEAMAAVPVPARGARLYGEYCIACHGSGAWGNAAAVVPALAGQRELYLLKQFVDFVETDRETPEMHRLMARKELGNPQSWRDLAGYLSELRVNDQPQVGEGRAVSTGKRVYREVCASCHGDAGQGDRAGEAPALRGQHYSYLVLQMRGFATGHRMDMELPALERIAGLSRAELEGLADYVSRLPVEGTGQRIASATLAVPANTFCGPR